MNQIHTPLKTIILLLLFVILSPTGKSQTSAGSRCYVKLIRKEDIRKSIVLKATNNDSNTYIANGSLFILLDPPALNDQDSALESTGGSSIQLTIYSSLENGQDINLSIPGDSSYFNNQQGSILFETDTSDVDEKNSLSALINLPLNVSGKVFLKSPDKPGGSKTSAPIIIRIDYY